MDKGDRRLPKNPNRETAEILRSTIQTSPKFVMFVTTNSKDSRWVPWELGLADGAKGNSAIALFPAAGSSGEQVWAKQEYLSLYLRIVWGTIENVMAKPGWIVWDYHKNTATPLRTWLGS